MTAGPESELVICSKVGRVPQNQAYDRTKIEINFEVRKVFQKIQKIQKFPKPINFEVRKVFQKIQKKFKNSRNPSPKLKFLKRIPGRNV